MILIYITISIRQGVAERRPSHYIMDVQTYPKRFLPEPFEAYWVLTESY